MHRLVVSALSPRRIPTSCAALESPAFGALSRTFSSEPGPVSQDPVHAWRVGAEKEARGAPLSKPPSDRLSVSANAGLFLMRKS